MDRKYLLLIVSFMMTVGIFVIIIGLLLGSVPGRPPLVPLDYMKFIPVLPGTIYSDMPLLFAIPIGFFALIYAMAPIISKVLVYLHKLIMRGAKYGFAQLGAEIKAGSFLRRAFMVSLFAFNMSAIFVGLGFGNYFRSNIATVDPALTLNESEAVFFGTFLFATAGLVVFMPLWIMEDSGLIMYRIFPDQRRAPDIEGVHSLYANLLKAYISISTLYTLWEYISKSFSVLKNINDPAILTPIILCFLPFLTIGLVSIPAYLYERFLPQFKKRVVSGLRSFNLPDIKIPDIQQIGVDHIKVD